MRVLLLLMAVCLLPLAWLTGQSTGEMSSKGAMPPQAAASSVHDDYKPAFTADGRLMAPTEYRQWIYLTSGLDMSYFPRVGTSADMSMFDNSFVNPASWQSFQQTGTWPDQTLILLEVRGAHTKGSINKGGDFQGTDLRGLEVHLKDASHGGWAFYEFDGAEVGKMTPATMVPKQAACYSCHEAHAAVDTTFVQFYPTLLPIAKEKGTLSANYLKDEAK